MDERRLSGIKNWAESDRPREKLAEKGRKSLTDAELLSILIVSGTKEETALDLSKRMLATAGNNMNELAKWGISEFAKFKGIGEAKAITILAALELGSRRKEAELLKMPKIIASKQAAELLWPCFEDLLIEECWVLLLNRGNRMIKMAQISRGGVSGTVVDPKVIFKLAIQQFASGIILCHNHPSGNLRPSEQDKLITKKMKEIGQLLDIAVLDHLILSEHGYYSFADEGLLN